MNSFHHQNIYLSEILQSKISPICPADQYKVLVVISTSTTCTITTTTTTGCCLWREINKHWLQPPTSDRPRGGNFIHCKFYFSQASRAVRESEKQQHPHLSSTWADWPGRDWECFQWGNFKKQRSLIQIRWFRFTSLARFILIDCILDTQDISSLNNDYRSIVYIIL